MTRKKLSNEQLDRIGRGVIVRSVLSDQDASDIAASPFLFARVRSRIRERDAVETSGVWSGLWLISRRALPAMGLVAAFSFGLFLYTGGNKSPNTSFSVDAYLGTNSGLESFVFAERRSLTAEEVLATIVTRDEGSRQNDR